MMKKTYMSPAQEAIELEISAAVLLTVSADAGDSASQTDAEASQMSLYFDF